MNNIKQTRFAELSLLFLAISLLVFLSSSASKAQDNSTVNLAGTEWITRPVVIPTSNPDNSVTTLTRSLAFYKQGKVVATVVKNKSAGVEYKQDLDLVPRPVLNAAKGTYELQLVYESVYKSVPTMPEYTPEVWQGTYEIKGKSIYLNFPVFTISATVNDNSMKGVVTYKSTRGKEDWMLFAKGTSQNSSNAGNSSRPISSTELLDLGLSLSKENSPQSISSPTSSKLKLGTYVVIAKELTRMKSSYSGAAMELETRVSINIQSIDNEGNVKVELSRYDEKRQFNGKIDASGNLQVEGSYLSSYNLRWNFTLRAITQGNKIINGRYLIDGGSVEVKGSFNEAIWERDF